MSALFRNTHPFRRGTRHVGPSMRHFIVALAILAMSATAVPAKGGSDGSDDDDSPVAAKLPDTPSAAHVYLFKFRANKVHPKIRAQDFCRKLEYGEAVLWSEDDTPADKPPATNPPAANPPTVKPPPLDWVICRFRGTK